VFRAAAHAAVLRATLRAMLHAALGTVLHATLCAVLHSALGTVLHAAFRLRPHPATHLPRVGVRGGHSNTEAQ